MRKLLFESLFRVPLTEPAPSADDAALAELAGAVGHAARRRLGRSLSIREVDAGSCNGCELEINALNNAFYDIERFGLRFVASPRHADVLLVTVKLLLLLVLVGLLQLVLLQMLLLHQLGLSQLLHLSNRCNTIGRRTACKTHTQSGGRFPG